MPELAEVEFYRKRWHLAAVGSRITAVQMHERKKLFRGINPVAFRRALIGATFIASEARAKQMLFRFRPAAPSTGTIWLGIHLGMTGELSVQPPAYRAGKHDHLVLVTAAQRRVRTATSSPAGTAHALVLTDPRMFGRILFHRGPTAPAWWKNIAPAVFSRSFTIARVTDFLRRRRRAPIKAVLLMQERFPGIGNWMADEILWRAAIHPARPAGSLTATEIRQMWTECRNVCRLALETIAGRGRRLPPDLNVHIPDSWLFNHRWQRGGRDPRTGTPLAHATIGGRTTCWSPARQQP